MSTISLEEAQARLGELVAQLQPGQEILILQHERPVARLVAEPRPCSKPRQPGSAAGQLLIHEDDDEHLEDFREYMR